MATTATIRHVNNLKVAADRSTPEDDADGRQQGETNGKTSQHKGTLRWRKRKISAFSLAIPYSDAWIPRSPKLYRVHHLLFMACCCSFVTFFCFCLLLYNGKKTADVAAAVYTQAYGKWGNPSASQECGQFKSPPTLAYITTSSSFYFSGFRHAGLNFHTVYGLARSWLFGTPPLLGHNKP